MGIAHANGIRVMTCGSKGEVWYFYNQLDSIRWCCVLLSFLYLVCNRL